MSPPSLATAGRHARFDQLLDRGHDLGVFWIEILARIIALALPRPQHGLAGKEVLHDGAEHGWLQMLPFAAAFRDRNEVGA